MARRDNELVYLPLGGAGEIGMNLYLYGFGPPYRRQWLMVDCGVTFGGEYEPGVDLIFPDIRFIEYICEENNRNPVDANGVVGVDLVGKKP